MHENGVEVHPSDTKQIWRVFWILLGITVVELTMAAVFNKSLVLRFALIAMTIVKAFYIVGYFMHLRFEKMNLILSVLIPLIFIVGIIAALLFESNYWAHIR